jgi:RNA polymerase sigma-70 factor (ECF subfamily)
MLSSAAANAAQVAALIGGDTIATVDTAQKKATGSVKVTGMSGALVGIARRILFRQDLAEEAVHDAFIRIWRGAAGFDPRRGSALGWLYAVVRNRALSIHRSEHRYEASDESVQDVDCEATLSRMPETSALRRCLEQIDRPRRDVVVLAYVHGMSHGELAGRLKVPLGTVKSWVRRSLFALQECMG